MAVGALGGLGSGTSTTSGTTLAVTSSTTIPAGTLLVLALTFDNHASTTAATLSLSASGGGTWTQRGTTTGSGVTTTAGSGIWGAVFTTKTTSSIANAATITTITFGSAVVSKSARVVGFTDTLDSLRNTVASGTSTAGTPSAATTGTALVANDLVIGTIHGENNAAPSADVDTLNGSWAAVASANTTGGGAAANTTVGIQSKIVTATGAQTYNATTANDSVAFVFALQPAPDPTLTQAAYRFYADGTETGSTALAAQDTAPTVDVSSGDVNLQLRTRLQVTANAGFASDDYQSQWEKNASGTWSDITASSTGSLTDSYQVTSGASYFSWSDKAVNNSIGQVVQGNDQSLKRVEFHLYKVGSPPGNFTANVYEATVGTYGTNLVPASGAASLAASTPVALSTLSGSASYIQFIFDGTFKLQSGKAYAICLVNDAVLDISNYIRYGSNTAAPNHAGNMAGYNTALSTWAPSGATEDLLFRLYTDMPGIAPYDSTNLTDGAATTNRLTGGTGSFVAGEISEDGLVDDLLIPASSYTELLYSLTLKRTDLTDGDTLRFRVLRNGATTGLTYTATPTINVTKTPPPKIETFTDTFDTQIDPVKWPTQTTGSTWESGRVKLETVGAYTHTTTNYTYDFTNSSLYAKITHVATPARSREVQFGVLRTSANDDGVQALLYYDGAITPGLLLRVRKSGVNSDVGWVTHDPVNHAWVRLRLAGTTVYLDTSPNGTSWTNITSTTTDLDLTACAVHLSAGQWQAESGTSFGYIDNINTAGDIAIPRNVWVTNPVTLRSFTR